MTNEQVDPLDHLNAERTYPAWIEACGPESFHITPGNLDASQAMCAALVRAHQSGDDNGVGELILTIDNPFQVIAALTAIARRLGDLAYGHEDFANHLAAWQPGALIGSDQPRPAYDQETGKHLDDQEGDTR